MIWTLTRILVFFATVVALVFGVLFLLETAGGIRIEAMGFEITLGPLQSAIGLVLLLVGLWLFLKLLSLLVAFWMFLAGNETALSRYWGRSRERRGYEALSKGLMALASGEGREAMKQAAKVDRDLKKPQLSNLLTAQAAELIGDKKKADETYRKLVADDSTRFIGVRGLMKQKLEDGDTETAMKLAEKAFALKPKHEETQDVLLRLQAGSGDWSGARKTLTAKLRSGAMPRDVHRRRDAVLALSEARDVMENDGSLESAEAAIEANRLSPDLIPAAVLASQTYSEKGKTGPAAKLLRKAWDAQPHPDLAAAFAALAPDETATVRLKRFQPLLRSKPDHPETKMLLAELHIAAEEFPEARRALGDLVETTPNVRNVTLMAAIEKGEGASDTVVKGWLARALTVPRGPQWVCSNCHHIHAAWAPVCENCSAFDTLAWTEPPQSEVVSATGMQMLPLIVGSLEDQSSDTDADDTVDIESVDVILDSDYVEPEENTEERHSEVAASDVSVVDVEHSDKETAADEPTDQADENSENPRTDKTG